MKNENCNFLRFFSIEANAFAYKWEKKENWKSEISLHLFSSVFRFFLQNWIRIWRRFLCGGMKKTPLHNLRWVFGTHTVESVVGKWTNIIEKQKEQKTEKIHFAKKKNKRKENFCVWKYNDDNRSGVGTDVECQKNSVEAG